MKKNRFPQSKLLTLFLLFILSSNVFAQAKKTGASIDNLEVEYTKTPIGIDVKAPRFSWQMVAPVGKRGYYQTKYQVIVKDPKGKIVWNTTKATDKALGIEYAGSAL